MLRWLGDIGHAVVTVIKAMRFSMRYWMRTYDPKRRTFTERFEYPELPLKVADRYRGFHRYDPTVCSACERCARDCPVGCIYVGKERNPRGKGFRVTSFTIDYTKCMFCGICTESCPKESLSMGSTHDLSCYRRDGCIVDFTQLPVEVARGRSTLNPTVVAYSKIVTSPVTAAPEQQQ